MKSLLLLITLAVLAPLARAEVRPSGIFSDNMVLQREAPVPVWGTAAPGERVTVAFAGQTKAAEADASGAWKAVLDPLAASSQPADLVISGTNTVTVRNVVVGDVWLCSGQSNMAFAMGSLKSKPQYAGDLTSADFPLIRQAAIPREASVDPVASRAIAWTASTPSTVEKFTAAGFYFAREIHRELGIPVGLIFAAWGGTSAESWTSKAALDTVPEFRARAEEQIANLARLPGQIKEFPAALAEWEKRTGRADGTNAGEAEGWMNPGGSSEGWRPAQIGSKWAQLGLPNGGIAWIRKEVPVTAAQAGKGFRLDLGLVNEQYVTAYWNGKKIGEFGKNPPAFYKSYTQFDIPGTDVKEGNNLLALRFVTHLSDRPPVLRTLDGMGLKGFGLKGGDCEIRVEKEFEPLDTAALEARPKTPEGDAAHTSSALFSGMISPVIPFAIRGALWYQGEQDASRALDYRKLLPLMITDWRTRWGQGDFPFLIQQLPNWKADGAQSTSWAELREAQTMAAEKLPNAFVSVALEIGEADDVHPSNKREAGRRLSLVALERVYGRDVKSEGPRMEGVTRGDGGTFRVKFRSSGALKTSDGKPPALFAVAGENRRFVDASAVIEGTEVVVSAPGVAEPVALRYAWINDTTPANLTDDTGLPAAPFRTDSWPIRGEK